MRTAKLGWMGTALSLIAALGTAVFKLFGPGGAKGLVAENLLLRQQLLIVSRTRKRAPNLTPLDRLLLGLGSLFVRAKRIARVAVVIRPSTLLRLHKALVTRKYRALFSTKKRGKPGPKGPSKELITAIIELKARNPRFGCPRIALIISRTFGIEIDKDVVRRVLAQHYKPKAGGSGPSWLTFLGHTKDSLWSVDLFRCESVILRSHWVMVVLDQYSRRIVGFGLHQGDVDAAALCGMLGGAIVGSGAPTRLSTDHDPLFESH